MVIYTNLLSPPECHGTLRGVKWSCIAEGPSEGSPVPVVQGASDSFARCQEWGRITGTLRLLEEQRYKQAQSHKDVYTVNRLNHPNIPKYQLPTKRNHNLETTAFKNEEKHLCLKCSVNLDKHIQESREICLTSPSGTLSYLLSTGLLKWLIDVLSKTSTVKKTAN